MYEYKGKVQRVVDGDTIVIDVDLGFECYRRVTFRILGLDTYETRLGRGTTAEDKKKGKVIKEFCEELLEGKEVIIKTHLKKGYYKRYLCEMKFKFQDENFDDHWIEFRGLMIRLGCDKKQKLLIDENSEAPKVILKIYRYFKDMLESYGILE